VLAWRAVRVGFVTSILWERFGPSWVALLADVGADVVVPGGAEVAEALGDRHLASVTGSLPRLAVAAAVACHPVDLLVVPALMGSRDGGPGAAQDPWLADLPAMVGRALPGGPPVVAVPVERGPHVDQVVIPVLTRVNRDAGIARRAWERHRRSLQTPWRAVAAPVVAAGVAGPRVALVGHAWWLHGGGAALVAAGAQRVTGQQRLVPEEARVEGRRVRPDLADIDAEVIGAARRFARSADVDVVRLVVDTTAPTAAWLERRVREVAGRSLEVVTVASLGDEGRWARELAPASTS
jgi:hypothetical protein